MESVRILIAIEGFIQLIEQEGFPDEAQLKLALDELALASNFCKDFEFDERELPDAPDLDQIKIQDMVYSKFPDYGMYNLPEKVADDLSETKLILGSAHDVDGFVITRDIGGKRRLKPSSKTSLGQVSIWSS